MLVEFKKKSQVTIPKEIVKKVNLNEGDKLYIEEKDGKIIITPVVVLPRDQDWYYSPEWVEVERQVDTQMKNGDFNIVNNPNELYKKIGIDE